MLLSVSVCLITKDQTEVISVFPVNVQVLEIKGHKKVAQPSIRSYIEPGTHDGPGGSWCPIHYL